MTTYTAFTAAIAALTVTGVSKQYTAPPASLATADLPASWPGLPRGEDGGLTFQSAGGWPVLFCDLVIAIEPVAQNTQSANYTTTVAIMDNLSTALQAATGLGRSKVSWSITANVQIQVADTTYWAVIATIEGR